MAQRVLKIIGILLALACLLVVRLTAQTESGPLKVQKSKLVNQP